MPITLVTHYQVTIMTLADLKVINELREEVRRLKQENTKLRAAVIDSEGDGRRDQCPCVWCN